MMNAAELGALLIFATAVSFTPGPNTTLSAALAANRGMRAALRFVCAVPVGWGLMFTASAAGLGALVVAQPLLRLAIVAGGVAYLLWLARRLWSTNALAQADSAGLSIGFLQGVGLQFLNIKAWMLALSLVAGWVAGRPDAMQRFGWVLAAMLAFAFVSNFVYAAIGSVLREWLAGPVVDGVASARRLMVFNRMMAVALALTAVWMLAVGVAPARSPGS